MIPAINIADFNYPLPEERIAKFPLSKRDSAKLLTYHKGQIGETGFAALPSLLPEKALLVFNETKVIPARLHFRKETGALIELFCLEPVAPADYEQSFSATASCCWKCIAGNSKRWKGGVLQLLFNQHTLQAELVEKAAGYVIVRYSWDGGISFAQVLEHRK